jgi:hypothetical protein
MRGAQDQAGIGVYGAGGTITVCAMMTDDPKSIVATGYDLIAEGYLERYGRSLVRKQWLGKLIIRSSCYVW